MRKLAIAAAALLLSITPLQASRRHIAGRGGPDPVFGVFVNVAAKPDTTQIGRALDLTQADGIGWVRIPFTWSTIQTSPGVANFLLYYPIVARANADNLRIAGVLGFSTPWNTTAPSSETRAAQREHYPPADFDAWYRYVLTTVSVFKDSVHYWEIWSSPGIGFTPAVGQACDGSWCGTSAQYAQLLSVAYKAVKTADPSAGVIVGGLSLGADSNTSFLYDILTDPNFPTRDAFDVMSFHAYGSKTEALRRMNFVEVADVVRWRRSAADLGHGIRLSERSRVADGASVFQWRERAGRVSQGSCHVPASDRRAQDLLVSALRTLWAILSAC